MSRNFCLLLSILIAGKLMAASHPAYSFEEKFEELAEELKKLTYSFEEEVEKEAKELEKFILEKFIIDDCSLSHNVTSTSKLIIPSTSTKYHLDNSADNQSINDSNLNVPKQQLSSSVSEDVLNNSTIPTKNNPTFGGKTPSTSILSEMFSYFGRKINGAYSTTKNICLWPFRCLGSIYNFFFGYKKPSDPKKTA